MLFHSAIMWVVFGAVSAYMAKARGKNPFLWFFLGMLFGVFGLLFLFFSPKPKGTARQKTQDLNTIDITPQLDPIHKEKFWYYLDPDNTRHGPMSFDALIRTWREGVINAKTYVWNENLEDWKPFGDFTPS